jgi:hypothetical protein
MKVGKKLPFIFGLALLLTLFISSMAVCAEPAPWVSMSITTVSDKMVYAPGDIINYQFLANVSNGEVDHCSGFASGSFSIDPNIDNIQTNEIMPPPPLSDNGFPCVVSGDIVTCSDPRNMFEMWTSSSGNHYWLPAYNGYNKQGTPLTISGTINPGTPSGTITSSASNFNCYDERGNGVAVTYVPGTAEVI